MTVISDHVAFSVSSQQAELIETDQTMPRRHEALGSEGWMELAWVLWWGAIWLSVAWVVSTAIGESITGRMDWIAGVVGGALVVGILYGLHRLLSKSEADAPKTVTSSARPGPPVVRALGDSTSLRLWRRSGDRDLEERFAAADVKSFAVRTYWSRSGRAEVEHSYPVVDIEGRGRVHLWTRELDGDVCRDIAEGFARAMGRPFQGFEQHR